MRNTSYPRYTIGKHSHEMFDLDGTQGLIQGIVELAEPEQITVEGLMPFEYLPRGETRTFTEGTRLEIVDFGGYHDRGGFVSELHKQAMVLEANARLTGPAAWRVVDASKPLSARGEGEEGLSNSEIGALVFIGVIFLIAAYLSPLSTVIVAGAGVLLVVALLFSLAYDKHRKRLIERMGSAYILAPKCRAWG